MTGLDGLVDCNRCTFEIVYIKAMDYGTICIHVMSIIHVIQYMVYIHDKTHTPKGALHYTEREGVGEGATVNDRDD